ncbi:outer membrane lipoprotein-sorting protein [bacterium]|nr:outer membrane lipoprotein-sorting protein [bacterium]
MKRILFGLIALGISGSVFATTPQEILEKVDRNRAPANTFTCRLKVSSQKEDGVSKVELLIRVKDAKKSLVLYQAPSSTKGRVLLMVEDNLWVYIPGTSNPIRISPQQQLMGQVSNADVARVVYNIDYQPDSVESETLGNEKVFVLKLSAKTKGAAYKAITLWVKPDTYLPIKAEFYALSGRHLKTAYYKNYKTTLGSVRPTVLEIHDAVQTNSITTLEYTDFTIDTTPEAFYQKTYMERFSSQN